MSMSMMMMNDDVDWYADSKPIRLKSSSLIIIIIAEEVLLHIQDIQPCMND
jgi:hypothetical protein